VMLSNGEHMFTKAEADLLRAKGINLDVLAPNADKSAEGKAEGGDIDAIIADLNKREASAKAAEEQRKKEFQAKLQAEKDAKKKADLQEQENKALQAAQNNLHLLDEQKKTILKKYEDYKNAPETRPSSDMGGYTKSHYVPELKKAIADYQESYNKYFPEKYVAEKSATTVKPSASVMTNMNQQVAAEQKKVDESRKSRTPEQTAIAAGVKNNPSVRGSIKNTTPNGVGISGVGKKELCRSVRFRWKKRRQLHRKKW
jgi:hypothetical protein